MLSCSNPAADAKTFPAISQPATVPFSNYGGTPHFNLNAEPTGHWTIVPWQRMVGPTIRIGVTAFHVEQVERVAFGCHTANPNTNVTNMTINPDTGYPEYWVELNLSSFTNDLKLYGFDAVVYPVYGIPTVIPRFYAFIDKTNSFVPEVRYVASGGSGNGLTRGSPMGSISGAFSSIISAQGGRPDGGEVVLLTSMSSIGSLTGNPPVNHWPILRGDDQAPWGSISVGGWNNASLATSGGMHKLKVERLQSVNVSGDAQNTYHEDSAIWVNDCYLRGDWTPGDTADADTPQFVFKNRQQRSYVTNCYCKGVLNGAFHSTVLLAGNDLSEIGIDVASAIYDQTEGILWIGNSLRDVSDRGVSSTHNDWFQWGSSGQNQPTVNLEFLWNKIYYSPAHEAVTTDTAGMAAWDNLAQLIRNFSMVGNIVEQGDRGNPATGGAGQRTEFEWGEPISGSKHGNMLWAHNTWIRQAVRYDTESLPLQNANSRPTLSPSNIENLSFRNNIFHSLSFNAVTIPSDGTRYIDNNHFMSGGVSGTRATTGESEAVLFGSLTAPGGPLDNTWIPLSGTAAYGSTRAGMGYQVVPLTPYGLVGNTDPPGSLAELDTLPGVGRSGLEFQLWGVQPSLGACEVLGMASVIQLTLVGGAIAQGNVVDGFFAERELSLEIAQSNVVDGFVAASSGGWINPNWQKRLTLDLDNTSFVVGADKEDFLVLVRLTSANSNVEVDTP